MADINEANAKIEAVIASAKAQAETKAVEDLDIKRRDLSTHIRTGLRPSIRETTTVIQQGVENKKLGECRFTGELILCTYFREPDTIYLISGTLEYPNGDTFEGTYHENNHPKYGTYTFTHKNALYVGGIESIVLNAGRNEGPIFDGFGEYTMDAVVYAGQWSGGQRHGKGTKHVNRLLVECGHYTRGVMVNGFKQFGNCTFQGEFDRHNGTPHHGVAVYDSGRYSFEGFFDTEPLYKKKRGTAAAAAAAGAAHPPDEHEQIVVPRCGNGNGKFFVQQYKTELTCKYMDDEHFPGWQIFKSTCKFRGLAKTDVDVVIRQAGRRGSRLLPLDSPPPASQIEGDVSPHPPSRVPTFARQGKISSVNVGGKSKIKTRIRKNKCKSKSTTRRHKRMLKKNKKNNK